MDCWCYVLLISVWTGSVTRCSLVHPTTNDQDSDPRWLEAADVIPSHPSDVSVLLGAALSRQPTHSRVRRGSSPPTWRNVFDFRISRFVTGFPPGYQITDVFPSQHIYRVDSINTTYTELFQQKYKKSLNNLDKMWVRLYVWYMKTANEEQKYTQATHQLLKEKSPDAKFLTMDEMVRGGGGLLPMY